MELILGADGWDTLVAGNLNGFLLNINLAMPRTLIPNWSAYTDSEEEFTAHSATLL
jgi:hypothetical protein